MGLEEEAVQKKHNRVMIYTIFWSLVFVVVVIYLNASQLKPVKGQMRIGVTYMTMNNEFYQTLNAEIDEWLRKGDLLLVRNPELDEENKVNRLIIFVNKRSM